MKEHRNLLMRVVKMHFLKDYSGFLCYLYLKINKNMFFYLNHRRNKTYLQNINAVIEFVLTTLTVTLKT